ncbi:MAG: cysteine desulfurase [Chlamydiia bacterium]|nr:cysteine desulfurase [Chlamydiia bacterium]
MKDVKKDFPVLKTQMHGKPLVYLDSAATSQKPTLVIDTIDDFYRKHYGTVHRAIYELSVKATEDYQQARKKVAKLLNAPSEDSVIFTRGTTEAINLVATSFTKAFIKPGDEILISEMEHHSNIVPWQLACENSGAVLKVAPIDDRGVIIEEEYLKLLSPKTKLVAIGHISNALGTVNPVKKLIKAAHDAGAKFLVDGAQGAPHLKVDVQDLDADFYVFSGHKIYGPTGIGVLYGKKELLDQMPPYQGGGDMIEEVRFDKTTYNILPMKFEAGTPLIAEAIGLGASIDYVNALGLDNIHNHEMTLHKKLEEEMRKRDKVKIIGTAPDKGAITSFIIQGAHHLDIGTLLDLRGVAIRTGHHCAQPAMRHFGLTGTARVSFGVYNTEEDVDTFLKSLDEAICELT